MENRSLTLPFFFFIFFFLVSVPWESVYSYFRDDQWTKIESEGKREEEKIYLAKNRQDEISEDVRETVDEYVEEQNEDKKQKEKLRNYLDSQTEQEPEKDPKNVPASRAGQRPEEEDKKVK